VLPDFVYSFSEAAHVATLHAVLFAAEAILLALSARRIFGPARLRTPFFPVSPLLAQLPLFLATLGNAALLPVLGLEAWLRSEMGAHFSVLHLVQLLAALECACMLVGVAVVAYNTVQYVKASSSCAPQQIAQRNAAESVGVPADRRRSAAISREGSNLSALSFGHIGDVTNVATVSTVVPVHHSVASGLVEAQEVRSFRYMRSCVCVCVRVVALSVGWAG
jgi:hypothetical protein